MTEPGTCDIFTCARPEVPVKTYCTYKCGLCGRPPDASLEDLVAHWGADHQIRAGVAR